MQKWFEELGNENDVVISSRIRLARNLEKYPFSMKISGEQAAELVEEVSSVVPAVQEKMEGSFYNCRVNALNDIDKLAMVERHIISPTLAVKQQSTGVILSEDESVSVMINEEDHVRIQAVACGMDMDAVWRTADRLDDLTYGRFRYAYDRQYGYLTSCPTNTGTGLRASYMMFLPALTGAGRIQQLCEEMGKYGVTMRGIYGEGTSGIGSIYQISNQKTLGNSEEEIIGNLNNIAYQVIRQERRRREFMTANHFDELEDQVYRSYGVLKYARSIGSNDAMTLLGQLKFGVDCGLIALAEECNFYSMMIAVQPANLQVRSGHRIGNQKRDRYRAEHLNQNLPRLKTV